MQQYLLIIVALLLVGAIFMLMKIGAAHPVAVTEQGRTRPLLTSVERELFDRLNLAVSYRGNYHVLTKVSIASILSVCPDKIAKEYAAVAHYANDAADFVITDSALSVIGIIDTTSTFRRHRQEERNRVLKRAGYAVIALNPAADLSMEGLQQLISPLFDLKAISIKEPVHA